MRIKPVTCGSVFSTLQGQQVYSKTAVAVQGINEYSVDVLKLSPVCTMLNGEVKTPACTPQVPYSEVEG